MAQRPRSAVRAEPASATAVDQPTPAFIVAVALLVPGAGHLLMGRLRKGLIFFVVVCGMFLIGLGFGGRLFPFQVSEPLAFLAAAAEWAITAPRIVAGIGGWGRGDVVAVTYEYGNAFLIVSGILNALIVLDAADRATGRKPR